ncbi:hypothetical protein EB001_05630 [bacterium]|nr:hypothetical protein [bacterium]
MAVQIQFRRDTGANWASANTILAAGEMGINTTTNQFKIGDGTTAWNSLSYAPISGTVASIDDITDVTITSASSGQFLKWNGSLWVNDAIDLGTDTTGSYVQNLVAGTGVSVTNNSGEAATPTIAVDTTVIAPLASPTFTGTVSGVTKTMVGLGNVDNTSDANKPVSTAQQTALDLKAPLASPTFTGTVTLPDNTVALGTKTTGDYVATITGGTGVSSTAATSGEGTTHTLSIGQSVATNANPTFAGATLDAVQVGITAAGEIDTTSGNLTIDSAGGTVTVDDNLVVTGNLTVSGSTTSVNTETLTVDDNIIVLNNNVTASPSENAGIEVERGSSTNVVLRWNETSDKWELTNDGTTYADIATESYAASLTPATLDAIGDVTITSASNGQFLKWNGSAWVNDAIDLGTDTTGNYMSNVSAGTGISVTHTPGEGSTATIAVSNVVVQTTDTGTVTSTMIADGTIVNADVNASAAIALSKLASGTSAQVIVADSSGVPTYRTLSGDVTVSNTGVVSIAADSVALGTDTTGNYMSNVSAGTGISVTHTPGEGSTATIGLNAGIDALNDVTITSAATNQLLQYNGTAWVNATVSTSPTWEDENNVISGRVFG